MALSYAGLSNCRRRLARIRCLQQSIECFRDSRPLPDSLCYITEEIEYKIVKNTKIKLYPEPRKKSDPVSELVCTADSILVVSGEDWCNNDGQWAKVIRYCDRVGSEQTQVFESEQWMLLYDNQMTSKELSDLSHTTLAQNVIAPTPDILLQRQTKDLKTWEEVVESSHSLSSQSAKQRAAASSSSSKQKALGPLQLVPANWTIEHDEDLAQFIGSHMDTDNEHLGSIKNYVNAIHVSSFCEDDGPGNLTDGDPDTFWESDGSQGRHWIRLSMKKGTIIKRLLVSIDGNDDNYLPHRISVLGGDDVEHLHVLNETVLDKPLYGVTDVCILEDQKDFYELIEIKIKECKDDGLDTRIHGIKIKSTKEKELGLSVDHFNAANLVRFPKLENYSPGQLYRRAIVLQRFIQLFDSVLPFIVPSWEYSIGSYSSLEAVRQFLLLSKKRLSLIVLFLRESGSALPTSMPKLFINRRAAAEHKNDPTLDTACKNTVFMQIFEGLKPRDRSEKPLDYRWSSQFDQWWECKFLSEGIIDQGGGFRDSLSDIADELCPSASDVAVPLPFFIRTPNQSTADSNINRDGYVPNSLCRDFPKYEWIGKLMGACLRGKENLVLSLPSFVWKKLAGERVTWSRDYVTVNRAEVKMIENMVVMNEDSFDTYFGDERMWTTLLCNETTAALREDGYDIPVLFDERVEYAQHVQEALMTEFNEQVDALRQGLLSVVPQAVLDLLTWQELERRVCGDPEITVEALKRSTHYEDLDASSVRVKHFWDALTNFSNEDRSRFLRFVTGRRRLPASLYICPDKGETVDGLPEASTCSYMLYLPHYANAKIAEDKLRYAAYNCLAIDTDMSPWDE